MQPAKNTPLEFHFDPQQPPLILGLYRVVDQLRLAQREAEYQLLAACWVGETWELGFTKQFLAGFDMLKISARIQKILTAWKYCPIQDQERRFAWLWSILFANDLLATAMKYSCDYLPSEAHVLLSLISDLHLGQKALERLDGWLDDPLHLVHAGQTPILTSSSNVAAGATVNGSVGIQINTNNDREFILGELLAARPAFVVLTDDLPDARQFRETLKAAGLQAYLYSEKNQ